MNPITLTVEVTAEDIVSAVRGDCSKCPIALALGRAAPDAVWAFAATTNLIYDTPYGRRFAATPLVAKDFMSKFDLALPVSPFTFTAEFV